MPHESNGQNAHQDEPSGMLAPEVASMDQVRKFIALGKMLADEATAQWSEPMQHAEEVMRNNPDSGTNDNATPPVVEAGGMLALIDRYVRDPSVDVEKFRALLTMKREMEAQEAETALIEALARVADKLKEVRIVKRREVSYDNKGVAFKYAALEDIDLILRPIIAAEGIVLTDTTIPRESGGALVIVRATHRLGAFREASIPMPLDSSGGKSNAQAMGSTLMYGRRQGRCMLFNIVVVGDDDDGTGGTIDEAQVKTIRDLLKQAHAADPVWSKKPAKEHETAFLRKIVRAPSIEEIPFRMYRKAKSELEDRIPSAHTL